MSRRVWSTGAAVLVAIVAAVASYAHQRDLAIHAGQAVPIASLLPLSVDGLLVVSTVALGDGRRSTWSAWLAFLVGVAASIVANVVDAQPGIVSRCVSAWPAVALLLVVEVIHRSGRAEVPAVVYPQEDTAPDTEVTPDIVVDTDVTPEVDTGERVRSLRATHPNLTQKDIAARLGVSTRTVSRHLNAATA